MEGAPIRPPFTPPSVPPIPQHLGGRPPLVQNNFNPQPIQRSTCDQMQAQIQNLIQNRPHIPIAPHVPPRAPYAHPVPFVQPHAPPVQPRAPFVPFAPQAPHVPLPAPALPNQYHHPYHAPMNLGNFYPAQNQYRRPGPPMRPPTPIPYHQPQPVNPYHAPRAPIPDQPVTMD